MALRTSAVILAAGAGSRLGGVAKALLPAHGQTFLQRIVTTACEVGCTEIIVVVGAPFASEVSAAATAIAARAVRTVHTVHTVTNPDPTRGMASSVAVGFEHLGLADAAFLWPVDHPWVTIETLRLLIDGLAGHDAARPRFGVRGGHPPLIARRAWPRFASCGSVEGGARTVMSELDVWDVPVEDAGVIRDVDTPADLVPP